MVCCGDRLAVCFWVSRLGPQSVAGRVFVWFALALDVLDAHKGLEWPSPVGSCGVMGCSLAWFLRSAVLLGEENRSAVRDASAPLGGCAEELVLKLFVRAVVCIQAAQSGGGGGGFVCSVVGVRVASAVELR